MVTARVGTEMLGIPVAAVRLELGEGRFPPAVSDRSIAAFGATPAAS